MLPTTIVGSYPDEDLTPGSDRALHAIRDMERARIDIVTDGKGRLPAHLSNRFLSSFEGIDSKGSAPVSAASGAKLPLRVIGKLAVSLAAGLNEERKDVSAAGIDVLQLDEEWVPPKSKRHLRHRIQVLDRALEGLQNTTVIHVRIEPARVPHSPLVHAFLSELGGSEARQVSPQIFWR